MADSTHSLLAAQQVLGAAEWLPRHRALPCAAPPVFSFSCGSSESQHAATLPPRLQALRRVAWEEGSPAGWRPRDREGHAACPWGARSMLLHGGFGGGIAFDLHLLIPDGAAAGGGDGSAGAGSSNAAASGAAGGSGGAAGGGTSHRWVQPRVAGTSPVPRYSHTLTRCGRHGEMAVVF